MGTVHFLRQSDRSHASMNALAKHQEMIDEIRAIHQKVGAMIDQGNALLDADLRAITSDPHYKFNNTVQEKLAALRAERELLTERADLLIKRAGEYLEWHNSIF